MGKAIAVGFGLVCLIYFLMPDRQQSSTAPAPKTATPAAKPAPAAPQRSKEQIDADNEKRAALIKRMIDAGDIKEMDPNAIPPRLTVRAGFMRADFEIKQNFCAVVWAYCYEGVPGKEFSRVVIVDAVNGKKVGEYKVGKLEMF